MATGTTAGVCGGGALSTSRETTSGVDRPTARFAAGRASSTGLGPRAKAAGDGGVSADGRVAVSARVSLGAGAPGAGKTEDERSAWTPTPVSRSTPAPSATASTHPPRRPSGRGRADSNGSCGLGNAGGRAAGAGTGGRCGAGLLTSAADRRRSASRTDTSFRVRGHTTASPTSSAVTGIGRLQHAQRTQPVICESFLKGHEVSQAESAATTTRRHTRRHMHVYVTDKGMIVRKK
jgi:hypothetical protein